MPNPQEPTEPAGMTPERWQRVNEIFHAAKEHPPTEAREFLTRACAVDATLRAAVENLLADDAQASNRPMRKSLVSWTPTTNWRLLIAGVQS